MDPILVSKFMEDLRLEHDNDFQMRVYEGSMVGSDDGTHLLVVPSDIIIDITVSGKNGLDTGSEAPNTWYYVWLILNESDGEVAGLFSVSNTSPTMPSGFTKKRLIGANRNNSSSNFFGHQQYNRRVYGAKGNLTSGYPTAPGTVIIDLSAIVPPGARSIAVFGNATTDVFLGGSWSSASVGNVQISRTSISAAPATAAIRDAAQSWTRLTGEQEVIVTVSGGPVSWEVNCRGYTHDSL
jgi:hypothetical protein